MKIQKLLADLSAHMGLAPVNLTDPNVCRLTFDEQTHVDLEPDPRDESVLLMHTVIGSRPPEGASAFYQKLLQGNYLARETAGSVLSVDPSTGEVLLHARLDAFATEVETLAERLTTFVSTAQDWAVRVQEHTQDTPQTSDAEPSFGHMIRV